MATVLENPSDSFLPSPLLESSGAGSQKPPRPRNRRKKKNGDSPQNSPSLGPSNPLGSPVLSASSVGSPVMSSPSPNSASPVPSPSPFRLNPESPAFIPGLNDREPVPLNLSDEPEANDEVEEPAEPEEVVEEDEKEKEKRRVRLEKMLRQVEYYLSDENLVHDEYLLHALANHPDQYIKLNTLCSFNRMKKLRANVKLLGEVLQKSQVLRLSENKKAVKRVAPLPEQILRDRCTIVVERLPEGIQADAVKARFAPFGTVESVELLQVEVPASSLEPPSASPALAPASPALNASPAPGRGRARSSSASSPLTTPALAVPASIPVLELSSPNPLAVSAQPAGSASPVVSPAASPVLVTVQQAHVRFENENQAMAALEHFSEHVDNWRRDIGKVRIKTPSPLSVARDKQLKERRKQAQSQAAHPPHQQSNEKPKRKQSDPIARRPSAVADDEEKVPVVLGRWGEARRSSNTNSPSLSPATPTLSPSMRPKGGLTRQAKGPDGTRGFAFLRVVSSV